MQMTDFSCDLYRMFDDADQLLYVGVTRHLSRRKSKHKKEKQWYGEVSRIECQPFTSRVVAEGAELKAIQTECPRYNIAGKTKAFQLSYEAKLEIWEAGQEDRDRACAAEEERRRKVWAELECEFELLAQS